MANQRIKLCEDVGSGLLALISSELKRLGPLLLWEAWNTSKGSFEGLTSSDFVDGHAVLDLFESNDLAVVKRRLDASLELTESEQVVRVLAIIPKVFSFLTQLGFFCI
mmetsp:Transcript_14528/g.19698  ORF Transcript_14528/g.19698 Transcript_14528/m.19698 type:complete len:108 (+) Transcript_14528:48-371(+)